MKTTKELQTQIDNIISDPPVDKRIRKKAERQVVFLRLCYYYLETNPSESFLLSERERLNKFLMDVPKMFQNWKSAGNSLGKSNPYSAFKLEIGVKKIKDSLKIINFLLA